MKTFFAVVVGCLCVSYAGAEETDVPYFKSEDIPGMAVTRTEHFDGKALFGYMDGGAELYREYGFVDLTVQEVRIDRNEFLVELFRMRDMLGAFGAFSISRIRCSDGDVPTPCWCETSGQVVGALGRYFFRVQKLSGGRESQGVLGTLARKLPRMLPDSNLVSIPWAVTTPGSVNWQRNAMVACGPLGLQNGYPDWCDPLEGGDYRSITIIPWTIDGTQATIGWIQCVSAEAASTLGGHIAFHRGSGWRYIRECKENAFLVIEADLSTEQLAQFADKMLHN